MRSYAKQASITNCHRLDSFVYQALHIFKTLHSNIEGVTWAHACCLHWVEHWRIRTHTKNLQFGMGCEPLFKSGMARSVVSHKNDRIDGYASLGRYLQDPCICHFCLESATVKVNQVVNSDKCYEHDMHIYCNNVMPA